MFEYMRGAVNSHRNPFTETDGSWCIKRIMATIASVVMLYKFCIVTTPDFANFALGYSSLIAALAMVNFAERGDKKPGENND
jgi:hypothetical protein